MTLKLRILRSLTRLVINLISLTRSLFNEKMLISNRYISGLMPNLIKKSWTDSIINAITVNLHEMPLLRCYAFFWPNLKTNHNILSLQDSKTSDGPSCIDWFLCFLPIWTSFCCSSESNWWHNLHIGKVAKTKQIVGSIKPAGAMLYCTLPRLSEISEKNWST